MIFDFYLLGTPGGRYSQYPDDYTTSILSELQEGLAGSRLIIHRKMDLVHYAFAERLDNDTFIGICLIFNKARFLKPQELIKLFRAIIEQKLVESGSIIKYNEAGDLTFNVNTLNECVKEYNELRDFIDSELEKNPDRYGIEPLKTIYNVIRTEGYCDIYASDEEIIALNNQHNTVILNNDKGIEQGYITQVISSLKEQIKESDETIQQLKEENASLNREKKQYRFVVLLAMVALASFIGLFFLNRYLNETKSNLASTETNLSEANDSIASLKGSVNTEKNFRKMAEDSLENINNLLGQVQPFVVKNISFNFTKGVLHFDYYGFRNQTTQIKVRGLGEDDYHEIYESSSGIAIKKGHNSAIIPLKRNLNLYDTYSFELLVDNRIIGGYKHTPSGGFSGNRLKKSRR